MAIPTPRSWSQILGDMTAAFLSRFGLKTLKVGGPVLAILEAAAQSDLRSSQDIFNLLNSNSLDRASGIALDRIGADENLPRLPEVAASGLVDITDTSFSKVSSKLYQGLPSPIVGSTTIYVADASLFPSSGSVYIGRSTINYEGPVAYTAKTSYGSYYSLTLAVGTQHYHNTGETVILAQGGNRTIQPSTVVQTPQGNANTAATFATIFGATIPDGEVQVKGVPVQAQTPGVGSNVIAGSIQSFVSPPFAGASVTNPLPFTNGQGVESDDSYRERIRETRASRTKGTPLALKNATQGLIATDENARISSVSVLSFQNRPTTVFVDDGTGYEEKTAGVALETIIDSASGGEQYFRVSARPVARASVSTLNQAPFNLTSGATLAVTVGGVLSQHVFDLSSFKNISNASAYEVVASINSDYSLPYNAATTSGGNGVRLFAKEDTLDDIQVNTPAIGVDANTALLFVGGRTDTLKIYKNDVLLSKDGQNASVVANASGLWGTLVSGMTLIIRVDGVAVPIYSIVGGSPTLTYDTYTIVDQDFIDAKTGFSAVGKNTPAAWAAVLNRRIPGITASVSNGTLSLTSDSGFSSKASIVIAGGTLVTSGGMFTAQTVTSRDSDYTFDRNTSEGRLTVPLVAGDKLTAGTTSTRAFLQSATISPVAIGGSGANLWFAIDSGASVVTTGLNASTSLTVSLNSVTAWGNRFRYTASSPVFSNVKQADWMLAWDSAITSKGTWRVAQVDNSGYYVDIERQGMITGRINFTATPVTVGGNPKILVAGGVSAGGVVLRGCELYDPSTNTWTATGRMANARHQHSATLLNNGKVLVVGGLNDNLPGTTPALIDARTLTSCEIWDPSTGTWSAAASTPVARRAHFSGHITSPSEKVVVAGGANTASGVAQVLSGAYSYSPSGDTWTVLTNMNTGRMDGASVVLSGGARLLAIGGGTTTSPVTGESSVTEVFDATAGTWTTVGSLPFVKRFPRAVLLASGKVLCAGGQSSSHVAVNYSETYDDGPHTWTATTGNMGYSRTGHSLVLLGNNKVLASFGMNNTPTALINSEVFDPTAGTWAATTGSPVSAEGRMWGLAVATTTGAVVCSGTTYTSNVGGAYLGIGSGPQASSELYNYTSGLWTGSDASISQASFSLASLGLVFVRANGPIQKASVSAGATLYTALSFANTVQSALAGAEASTYRTSSYRVNTTTYGATGDIALVSADSQGASLGLTVGPAIPNLSTHLASVASGKQYGTPEFTSPMIIAGESLSSVTVYSLANEIKANSYLVGLRDYDESYNSATPIYRTGSNRSSVSMVASLSTDVQSQKVGLRVADLEVPFRSRLYVASPFSVGPSDDLVVVVDQDTDSKRYSVPLYRRLSPTTSTYGLTNYYTDRDNGGAALSSSVGGFGASYDFTDYSIYMASRALHFPGDANRSLLWRYTKLGPDGDKARVKFVYPTGPLQTTVVTTSPTSSKWTDISVQIPSGAARVGYSVRANTFVGQASAAGPGGLSILSYILGYSVSSATRYLYLDYTGLSSGTGFTVGETVTGGSSGAHATVAATGGTPGTNGTVSLTGLVGSFSIGETITGGTSGKTATTATSQYYLTVATLTLPTTGGGALMSITDHGLTVGENVYLASTSGSWTSGVKTIVARTANTISFQEASGSLTTVANIGDISYDIAEALFSGASIAVGDLIRISSASGLTAPYVGTTMRIAYLANQVIQGYVENVTTPTSVPVWSQLISTAAMSIFQVGAANTVSSICASVASAASAQNSTCPITAKSMGTGTGTVTQSSADEALTAGTWVSLSDGFNSVASSVYDGTLNYAIQFKNTPNSSLATGSDWANEDIRLVPVNAEDISDWLSTQTVTGLSSSATIEVADQAQRVQITSLTAGSTGSVQVQGGASNSASAAVYGSATLVTDATDGTQYSLVTVPAASATNLFSGMWVAAANTTPALKSIFSSAAKLTSWTTSGVMSFDTSTGVSVYGFPNSGPILSTTWQVEKHGNFVCYSFNCLNKNSVSPPDLSNVKEGCWVYIKGAATPSANAVTVSSVNTGIYRVVRAEDGTQSNSVSRAFWIENPNASAEYSEMDVTFLTYDSVIPGDKLFVGTPFWGSTNVGVWTVESVGDPTGSGVLFGNSLAAQYSLKVSVSSRTVYPVVGPGPGSLGSLSPLVQVQEGTAGRFFKKIRAISPNQNDGTYVDIKFETAPGYKLLSEATGTVLTALDKLSFPTSVIQGVDGYRYSTGLIAEANRVLYGDPQDPGTYPGVVAAGAGVDISAPLIKRIQVGVSVRLRSGVSVPDSTNQVRSAVSAAINRVGVGQSVPISDIVDSVSQVNGVLSVAIVSPTYSPGTDLIPVQPYEKPLVLNLDQDILVSIVS